MIDAEWEALREKIRLPDAQEQAVREWAADDRLWTTQEMVEFNLRVFARKILQLGQQAAPAPSWQPMETMPEVGQVIVCWSDDTYDTIGKAEYLECVGFGEPPAKGWMPLPAPPGRDTET